MSVDSDDFSTGDGMFLGCDDLFPCFVQIRLILFTCLGGILFVCEVTHSDTQQPYQAHEMHETAEYTIVSLSELQNLLSPWPLHYRTVAQHTCRSFLCDAKF